MLSVGRTSLLAALCTASSAIGRSRASTDETFIAAHDPAVWYTGRTMVNSDGSRSFDWEGTQLWVNVQGASYVKMVINATNGMVGRFSVEANGVEASSFFVGASKCDEKLQTCNEYLAAQELNGAGVKNTTIRAISILEPAFGGAGKGKTLTFYGWKTDGTVLPASPPRARKIELLGDSISAGYGSRGNAALHAADECPVNDLTSGNLYTYNWKIAEHFSAQLVPIAWSGKGMYKNCCDNGELMPAYWLQTLAGMGCSTPACTGSTDWDHSRYVPDMMIINLGTNDFGHDSGAAWEKEFSDTYTEFVLNATRIYQNPKLPVFVAQVRTSSSLCRRWLVACRWHCWQRWRRCTEESLAAAAAPSSAGTDEQQPAIGCCIEHEHRGNQQGRRQRDLSQSQRYEVPAQAAFLRPGCIVWSALSSPCCVCARVVGRPSK